MNWTTGQSPCDDPAPVLYDITTEDWSGGKDEAGDQWEIRGHLKRLGYAGKRVLQIGLGDHSLAEDWLLGENPPALLHGLTLQSNERRIALEMNLPLYRVFVGSKYDPEVWELLRDDYNWIIEPEIVSYACCGYHTVCLVQTMLEHGAMVWTHTDQFSHNAASRFGRIDAPSEIWRMREGLKLDIQRYGKVFSIARNN